MEKQKTNKGMILCFEKRNSQASISTTISYLVPQLSWKEEFQSTRY